MTCNNSCGSNSCPDSLGCPADVCPDFVIRRHDTKPSLKLRVEDCDGPLDLTDLVVESSMWAKGKLKAAITADDTYFSLADNIGFEQAMVGDIIVMNRVRLPEHMLVVAFDETNSLIQVQRGYHGTTASAWKKGASLRIMRYMATTDATEMILQDIPQVDGTTATDQVTDSFLVHEWSAEETCLPGCYYLEFKLLKMTEESSLGAAAVDPSFTDPSLIAADFGCSIGAGVEWVRRFPVEGEGLLIQIIDSPTAEL